MDDSTIEKQPLPEPEAPRNGYVWVADSGQLRVSLDFDLVDRLGFDVMRGFGAIPRRGAEVGGVLLGRIDQSATPPLVRVDDFLLVPCEHAHGPSFLLSEGDLAALDQIVAKAGRGNLKVAGFFRSNTRDQMELTPEDREMVGDRLTDPQTVFLMIRPHATRIPEATFFLKRDGQFLSTPAGPTFPFRRKDLGGGRPAKKSRFEPVAKDTEAAAVQPSGTPPAVETAELPQDLVVPAFRDLAPSVPVSEAPQQAQPEKRTRSTWVWLPLSFIFLLLGVVLGFQIALSFRPPQPVTVSAPSDPYSINLSVSQFNNTLHLRWNADAAAIRAALRAVLHIQDGDNLKNVTLDKQDLLRGGVLYRNTTGSVLFRLEIFPKEKTSVSESVDIRVIEGVSSTAEPER